MSSFVIRGVKALPKITIKPPKIKIKSQTAIDEVCGAVTKTTKPKVTIKATSSSVNTTNRASGVDILAEQNRAMLGRNNQTQLNIRGISNPNPHYNDYIQLCNSANFTVQEAELLVQKFKELTGLNLYCSGNVRGFEQTLSIITDEVKAGRFPKEKIKHILIGHGTGNIENKTWCTADGPILKYINSHPKMEKGDLVLVACCETNGKRVLGKPAKGHQVELSLCDSTINREGRGPAKIIRVGEEDICGQYSISKGFELYE